MFAFVRRLLALPLVLIFALLPAASMAMPIDPALYQVWRATWFVSGPNFSCTATAIDKNADVTFFITASHCAASDLQVFLPGTKISAKADVVANGGGDDQDWAVLSAPVQAPAVIPLDRTDDAYIGEPIVTSGFPWGVGPIVTTGIISGQPYISEVKNSMLAVYVFGAPGASGSAIVARDTQKVVGILVSGLSDESGPWLILAVPATRVQWP